MSFSDRIPPRLAALLPILALVAATGFWGSSFLTVSTALSSTDPYSLVFMRFAMGACVVLIMLRGQIGQIPAVTWKAGAVCALAIYGAYLLNHIGLETILSSTSGFLTALYVPLTPFLFWAVTRRSPDVAAFIGALVAFAGLVLIADPFSMTFENNLGEWLTILSAFLSALEIILMGRFAPACKALELTFAQLFFVALYAGLGTLVAHASGMELTQTVFTKDLLWCLLWLAVILSASQMLLAWGQKFVAASTAAVIFALESVFAAVIGWIAGERLGALGLTGGALIVMGVLVTEIPSLRKNLRRK